MPRPKSKEPMSQGSYRLTDRQWLYIDKKGGAKWLRELIQAMLEKEQNAKTN